mgnify:CR=1 FL=1
MAGVVKVITATQSRIGKITDGVKRVVLRVCAYCRVSTDNEEQQTSYKSQKTHYKTLIEEHEDWEFVDIYADEGITGTKTAKRTDFHRMIDDALAGKIDMIIAKSISRFARNTVDTLNYVRKLRDHNVDVWFEKENIHTLELTSEMFLTLYSAFAQAESESISENVKMGVRAKMKRGELVGHYAPYGFIYDEEIENLVEVPNEAFIVRYMFDRYKEGVGTSTIARELNDKNIPSPTGKKWSDTVVFRMIRNEKYVGDLLTGKTYTDNPINSKKKKNKGEFDMYYTENHHEGIIDRETWDKCQEIANRRSGKYTADGKPEKFSQVYPFSSKIVCGLCGENYIRRSWKARKEGEPPRAAWACRTYNTDHLSCQSYGNVKESYIEELFLNLYSVLCKYNKQVVEKLLQTIEETFENDDYSKDLKKIEAEIKLHREQLLELLDVRLAKIIDNDVFEQKSERINKKIELLELEAKKIKDYVSHREQVKDRVERFRTIFETNTTLKEFDADVFESLIDRIIIGRRNDDGSIDPYEVRFVLKTGDELTDTLPIKNKPSSRIQKRNETNETDEKSNDEMCAYAHNGKYSTRQYKSFDCLSRKQLFGGRQYQNS